MQRKFIEVTVNGLNHLVNVDQILFITPAAEGNVGTLLYLNCPNYTGKPLQLAASDSYGDIMSLLLNLQ